MRQYFTTRSLMRSAAAIGFSIFSYAAMAQSIPSTDACGHALSGFQKRLYARFLAGPDTLRNYVFAVRSIHLLDIREVDEWGRDIRGQVCREAAPVVGAADESTATPLPPIVADAAPVPMTRAAVRQELALARATRQLQFGER